MKVIITTRDNVVHKFEEAAYVSHTNGNPAFMCVIEITDEDEMKFCYNMNDICRYQIVYEKEEKRLVLC